jgi:hypothetical protein
MHLCIYFRALGYSLPKFARSPPEVRPKFARSSPEVLPKSSRSSTAHSMTSSYISKREIRSLESSAVSVSSSMPGSMLWCLPPVTVMMLPSGVNCISLSPSSQFSPDKGVFSNCNVCAYVCMYACITCVYMHVCVCGYAFKYVHVCMHVNIYMYIQIPYVCINTCTHMYAVRMIVCTSACTFIVNLPSFKVRGKICRHAAIKSVRVCYKKSQRKTKFLRNQHFPFMCRTLYFVKVVPLEP